VNPYRKRTHLLKLMAQPVRLQIMDTLIQDEECVCHLSAILNRPQPYVSQQLAVLRKAGLLASHKQGTNVSYRIANESVAIQVKAILGPLADHQLAESIPHHVPVIGCTCPKCKFAAEQP